SLARLLLSPARPSLRIVALLPRRLRGAAGFASTASRRPPACRPPGQDRCLKPLGHLSELSLHYHPACAAPPVLPRLRRGALRPPAPRAKTGASTALPSLRIVALLPRRLRGAAGFASAASSQALLAQCRSFRLDRVGPAGPGRA